MCVRRYLSKIFKNVPARSGSAFVPRCKSLLFRRLVVRTVRIYRVVLLVIVGHTLGRGAEPKTVLDVSRRRA